MRTVAISGLTTDDPTGEGGITGENIAFHLQPSSNPDSRIRLERSGACIGNNLRVFGDLQATVLYQGRSVQGF